MGNKLAADVSTQHTTRKVKLEWMKREIIGRMKRENRNQISNEDPPKRFEIFMVRMRQR